MTRVNRANSSRNRSDDSRDLKAACGSGKARATTATSSSWSLSSSGTLSESEGCLRSTKKRQTKMRIGRTNRGPAGTATVTCRKNCFCKIDVQLLKSCGALETLRRQGSFCDITLQGNDSDDLIRAHQVVLLTLGCKFFRAHLETSANSVLSLGFAGSYSLVSPPPSILKVAPVIRVDMPTEILQEFVRFAYSGEYRMHSGCSSYLTEILRMAKDLDISGILKLASDFMLSDMRCENAVQTFLLAKNYLCQEIRKQVKKFILHNFQDICELEQGGQQSKGKVRLVDCEVLDVEEFLKDDELNIKEERLFEVVAGWACGEKKSEGGPLVLRNLLKHIRFSLMDPEFFESKVEKSIFVSSANRTTQKMLAQTRSYLARQPPSSSSSSLISAGPAAAGFMPSPQQMSSSSSSASLASRLLFSSPRSRPHKTRIPNEIVFAVGGWGADPNGPTSCIETFDIRAFKWNTIKCSSSSPRAYHGMALIDKKIYLIGGYDGVEYFSAMVCFDPSTKTWQDKAPMHHMRCYVATTVLDRKIYALGGYNGRFRLSSMESYDPDSNLWTMLPPMRVVRSDSCAVSYHGKIYAIAGFTGEEVLNSVEVFDPDSGEWTFGPRLNSVRSGVKAVVYRDRIYVLGGFDGHERLKSVECLDLKKPGAGWTLVADMLTQRSNFSVAVVDDKILVMGGFETAGVISKAEAYCGTTNTWIPYPPMDKQKSALSAVTISGISNAAHFVNRTLDTDLS